MTQPLPMNLIVRSATPAAANVVRIELTDPAGAELPQWEAGAHIDVHLPSGIIRQYSLCGDTADRSSYTIAVLMDETGRGGSVELCEAAVPGRIFAVSAPRNLFPLRDADSYLLIAGGIGITPLLTLAREAGRQGKPWQLVYGGRSRAAMALIEEVSALAGGAVTLLPQDEGGMPDLRDLIGSTDAETLIYCCGPAAMLDAASAIATEMGCSARLQMERFEASLIPIDMSDDQPFEVELARSGLTLTIPADRTLKQVLEDEGVPVSFSCEEGYCGTCETGVLEGVPDHRDSVLSDEDRASSKYMMVCVSRAKTPRLVLDL